MIENLQRLIPTILKRVQEGLDRPDTWDSLAINRRKPHTNRIFQEIEGFRVCLHRFEACEENEAFPHPHPWPGAFLLLEGEYIHTVGGSADLKSRPEYFIREIIRPYSIYEIINTKTWHKVQPLKETYTVTLNGVPWTEEERHEEVRTTKGKGLQPLSDDELVTHLVEFERMLHLYNARS